MFFEEPIHTDGPARLDCQAQDPNLDVLCPYTPVGASGFHDDQLAILRPLLAAYLAANHLDDYIVWFYTPLALPLASELNPRAIVYDCMDELSAFKHAPRQLRQRESALLRQADLVLTGGPSLYEAKRHLHGKVHCLPSGVDAHHFAPHKLDACSVEAHAARRSQASIGHPRLGFFGVIDERFDVDLLTGMAQARPQWQFVMAGPIVKIDAATLPRLPNVHWLGMQRYAVLPYLVAGWDVCLLPFALNESTRFISPTKTLEYLAAAKPVVSSPIRDVIALYGEVVRIAQGSEEFIAACQSALAESRRDRQKRAALSAGLLSRFSWERGARTVGELVAQAVNEALARGAAATCEKALPPPAAGQAAARAARGGANPFGLRVAS